MRKIIFNYIILQLLYLNRRVESLGGSNVIVVRNGEFPYVASIQLRANGTKLCTGTLITRRYIVTHSRCVSDRKPKEIQVTFELTSSSDTVPPYKVDSYLTYDKWAKKNRKTKEAGSHYIAVVKLKDKVHEPEPIRLTTLPNDKLGGMEATITGWHADQFRKASVNILSNQDCEKTASALDNRTVGIDPGIVCSIGVPQVLLGKEDAGAPLIGVDNTLVGLNYGFILAPENHNFSDEFLQQHEVNLHASVSYYWYFIVSATDYH